MMPLGEFSSWLSFVGWALVHSIWQIALLGLALKGLLYLLRHQNSRVRYSVACLALLGTIVLPVLTAIHWHLGGNSDTYSSFNLVETTRVDLEQESLLPAPSHELTKSSPSWSHRLIGQLEEHLHWVVYFWGIGVCVFSIWHIGGFFFLSRWRQQWSQPVSETWRRRAQSIAGEMGVRRKISVRASSLLRSPAVIGWIRPTILFPFCVLSNLPSDCVEALLRHELAHIRRNDYLVNVLQIVTEVIGFYHPVLWWINQTIRLERECCCDELAANRCIDRRAYAQALLSLEELRLKSPEPALGATDHLRDRIYRLLGFAVPAPGRFRLSAALAVLVIMGVCLGLPGVAGERYLARDWLYLFDGRSLTNWQHRGGGAGGFSVQDGCIVGTSQGKGAIFLCTDTHYRDFELTFEVLIDRNLNAGVQFRSQVYDRDTVAPWKPKQGQSPSIYEAGSVFGYQVEISGEGDRRSGSLWDEQRLSAWLTNTADDPLASQAWQESQWNRYRVVCRGDRIRTWVNGILCSDIYDARTPSGFIALQAFNRSSSSPLSVRWRELRLREL